jgi:Arc/MetJ family transcription regulator
MITMKEWMELVDYKITEGGDYGWSCYGPNAYTLDSWNGVHGNGGYSFSIVFSTKTQKVYEVTVCDYTNNRAYRMINPDKVEKHRKEAIERSVNLNEAWDDVEYTDLEVDDDLIQKCLAIRAGQDYSTDISVPIDLPDHVLLEAAMNAHRQNITLNAYINNALRELLEEYKRDPESLLARADKWKEENDVA